MHAGLGWAVLWHAPRVGTDQWDAGGISVLLDFSPNMPNSVSADGPWAPEAESETAIETASAPSPDQTARTSAEVPSWQSPSLQSIEPQEVLSVETVHPAAGSEPVEALPAVEPAQSMPAEAVPPGEPVEAAPLKSMPSMPNKASSPLKDAAQVDVSVTMQPTRAVPVEAPRTQPLGSTTAMEPLEEVLPGDELAPAAPESERRVPGPAERTAAPPAEVRRKPVEANITDTRPGPQTDPLERSPPVGNGETRATVSLDGSANRTGDPGSGTRADYLNELQTWLEKHKEYPFRARLRRQEGTALLYFVVDRNGVLRDYELRRRTGHALLDQEVLAMVRRAQPLPGVPAYLNQPTLELIVPVRFSLR